MQVQVVQLFFSLDIEYYRLLDSRSHIPTLFLLIEMVNPIWLIFKMSAPTYINMKLRVENLKWVPPSQWNLRAVGFVFHKPVNISIF